MKLQKLLLTALASGLFFSANAQQAYFKLGAGYNFGVSSEIAYQTNTTTYFSSTGGYDREITSYEGVNVNFGKGIPVNATFGYRFSKHIGAELAAGYLRGGNNTLKNAEFMIGNNVVKGGSSTENQEMYSRMVLVQPSVVLSGGLEGKLNPYTRFGMVLAFGSLHGEASYADTDGNTASYHEKLDGGVGMGLQAALGTDIGLSDKTAFFAEFTFSNLSYSPTKGELTEYVENGRNRLPALTPAEKQTEFQDKFTEDSDVKPISTLPSIFPKSRYTMNTVGLQVGMKYKF